MKKIAFLFPGQGAQYPGMGFDFFQKYREAKELFYRADTILGMPFSETIFQASPEELTQTKNSQLAIFITSLALLRVIQAQIPHIQIVATAGLSLGEYSALVASEMMTFEEALLLVQSRAKFMQRACENHPGIMSVILGLELSQVKEAISAIKGVWIANLNCPGQIVLSGTKQAVKEASTLLKEQGASRILPLKVSGAFHSGLMQEAQDLLEPLIQKAEITSSSIPLFMNVPGSRVQFIDEVRSNMVSQLTSSVLWQKEIEEIENREVDFFVEMGPGRILTGMNKKIGVKVPTLSIQKIEDLPPFLEKIQGACHATT